MKAFRMWQDTAQVNRDTLVLSMVLRCYITIVKMMFNCNLFMIMCKKHCIKIMIIQIIRIVLLYQYRSPTFLFGNYYRHTDRPTDGPTNRPPGHQNDNKIILSHLFPIPVLHSHLHILKFSKVRHTSILFGLCFVLFYFHDKDLVVYVLISIGLVTISTKPLANVRCIEGTYNTSRLKNIL